MRAPCSWGRRGFLSASASTALSRLFPEALWAEQDDQTMKAKAGLYLLAVSLLICVLLRVPYFQHPFVFIDEAWWAPGSKAFLQGERL